ncbi:HDOD domain-containing protein [Trichlorobacter ammonificans]|uniref:HD-like signal output (HDOD) domain, no enzymatic activity n=1 Tax=Trichlorobacter ammonificans TaxID=2916410 RepID=A0ABM9D7J7_9BACT|nr:HDOD domain-containing protein [Trichlorobacter ammonificans]CAH2031194.1 HD-like signal output (HDOD) domain, no enzymatic activity [Trichlorobacter ammonificans]
MSQVELPETVKKLIASQPIELPIFHPVALKLQRMLSDYDFTVDEVAQVSNEDQALASQMLKMANSPMYMGRTKVATIKEAVIRLGAQQVINIAIAASQAAAHASENPALNSYMKALWQHSHGAALGARWLAHNCGMRGIADEIYLAALLHDVGKLYLLKAIERLVKAGVISSMFDDELIREIFEVMHVEQGHRLMQHWNFPAMYCDVVRDHHCEQWDPINKMLAIVRLVNLACHRIGLGLKHTPVMNLLRTLEAEVLDLGEMQIAELEALLEDSRDAEF